VNGPVLSWAITAEEGAMHRTIPFLVAREEGEDEELQMNAEPLEEEDEGLDRGTTNV
jgi:hypothetical protein